MKKLDVRLKGGNTETIVDDDVYEWAKNYTWWLIGSGYVARQQYSHFKDGKSFYNKPYLHREIMEARTGQEIDHINRNKLDNRRENLRFCTKSQNMINRPPRKNAKSKYKGVRPEPLTNIYAKKRWRAEIRINGVAKYIGNFMTEVEAARAYNETARVYYGDFAYLNEV